MSQRIIFVVICAALLAALSPMALAQDAKSEAAETYDTIIQEALHEYRQEMWEEARTLFHRAHELQPSARTWFGIGTSSFQAQRYVEAVHAFEASLSDTRKPLSEKMRAEASSTLVRAKRFVGQLQLRVTPSGVTPVVTIDGIEVDASQPVMLVDPGRREVVVKAEGYAPVARDLRVDGGGQYTLELELQAIDSDAVVKKDRVPLERKPAPADEAGSSAWPWIGVAASGAVAIGGGVLLVLGLQDVDTVENAELGTRWDDIRDAKERAPVLTGVGAVMLGVGLVGASICTFVLLDGETQSEASVSVVPGGLVVHGRI